MPHRTWLLAEEGGRAQPLWHRGGFRTSCWLNDLPTSSWPFLGLTSNIDWNPPNTWSDLDWSVQTSVHGGREREAPRVRSWPHRWPTGLFWLRGQELCVTRCCWRTWPRRANYDIKKRSPLTGCLRKKPPGTCNPCLSPASWSLRQDLAWQTPQPGNSADCHQRKSRIPMLEKNSRVHTVKHTQGYLLQ